MKHIKLFENHDEFKLVDGGKYEVLIDTYISYWKKLPGTTSGLSGERVPLKKGDIVEYVGKGGAWGHDDVNVAQFKTADGTIGELAGTGLWGQLPDGVLKNHK